MKEKIQFQISKRTGSLGGLTFCDVCGWGLETISVRSALGHGAKHARRTGHKTFVECHTSVIYEPVMEEK